MDKDYSQQNSRSYKTDGLKKAASTPRDAAYTNNYNKFFRYN